MPQCAHSLGTIISLREEVETSCNLLFEAAVGGDKAVWRGKHAGTLFQAEDVDAGFGFDNMPVRKDSGLRPIFGCRLGMLPWMWCPQQPTKAVKDSQGSLLHFLQCVIPFVLEGD